MTVADNTTIFDTVSKMQALADAILDAVSEDAERQSVSMSDDLSYHEGYADAIDDVMTALLQPRYREQIDEQYDALEPNEFRR